MIPNNLEYLFEYQGYDFYGIEEYGFSLKKLARDNKLYEKFGHNLSSTYYEIYTLGLYEQSKLSQIWIFKDDKPIGISIALHYDDIITITDASNKYSASILGQIHLFTLPEHRGKGLAGKTISILENMLLTPTPFPPCILLQDNAFPFAKKLEKTWGLPNNEFHGMCEQNKILLSDYFENLIQNENQLQKSLKRYPKLQEQFLPKHKTMIF
jgi:GNAT superfamily N-acetyltransferase